MSARVEGVGHADHRVTDDHTARRSIFAERQPDEDPSRRTSSMRSARSQIQGPKLTAAKAALAPSRS
jgi:hypothetical protein